MVEADFTATPTFGDAPLSIDFTDQSTGSPTGWVWDFGDGGSSTDQNPTHIYTTEGVFTVTLMASDIGSSDREVKTDYIMVDTVLLSASGDKIYRSDDGSTWEEVYDAGTSVYSIVRAEGYDSFAITDDHLLKSINGGVDWTDEGALGFTQARKIEYCENSVLLVMTDTIVYRSTDYGVSWSLVLDGDHEIRVKNSVLDTSLLDGPRTVHVSGDYAYIAARFNNRFTVVDISNPEFPNIVGYATDGTTLNDAYGLFVSGNYAYVTLLDADRFTVVDISDPKNPSVEGSVYNASTLNAPYAVYVDGSYAYVAVYNSDRLTVIDVSTPSSPLIIGGAASGTTLNQPRSVFVQGSYAYVAAFLSNRLTVVDISTPASPSIVADVQDATDLSGPQSVYVSGNYAYVAAYSSDRFTVVDISNPLAPFVEVSIYDATYLNGPREVKVSGNYAYIAVGDGDRITKIDISDPTAPFIVGSVEDSVNLNNVLSLFVVGDYIYSVAYSVDRFSVAKMGVGYEDIKYLGSGIVLSLDGQVRRSADRGASFAEAYSLSNAKGFLAPFDVPSSFDAEDAGYESETLSVVTSIDDSRFDGANSVFIDGDYAYVCSRFDNRLVVVDISDPVNPSIVGSVQDNTVLEEAFDVKVRGDYAYVAALAHYFTIVDVSDPTAPFVVGSVTHPTYTRGNSGVDLSGDYAFVAVRFESRITAIDISNPASPSIVDSLYHATNLSWVMAVSIVGDYAFLPARDSDRFTVVNISDPSDMFIVASITDTRLDHVHYVFIKGIYAYVPAFNADRLTIIDISDPTAPSIVGSVQDSTNLNTARAVQVLGNRAFVTAVTSNRVTVVDVNDPTNPIVVSSIQDNTNLDGSRILQVDSDYIYVPASDSDRFTVVDYRELRIVDLSATQSGYDLPIEGSVEDATNFNGPIEVQVVGNYAYVAARNSDRITVVDVSDPTAPFFAASVYHGTYLDNNLSIAVRGNYAYAAPGGYDNYLTIVDISNPLSPSIAGWVAGGINVNFARVRLGSGDYAYIVSWGDNKLTSFDISNPSSPSIVDSIQRNTEFNNPRSLGISGDYAFVGSVDGDRITAIDISDPTAMSFVSSLHDSVLLEKVTHIHIVGNYAYVCASDASRLTIVDISNPASMIIVGSVKDTVNLKDPRSTFVSGNYAYVGDVDNDRFTVVDISDVSNPIVVGSKQMLGNNRYVWVEGDYAYITSASDHRLTVVDISRGLRDHYLQYYSTDSGASFAFAGEIGSASKPAISDPEVGSRAATPYPSDVLLRYTKNNEVWISPSRGSVGSWQSPSTTGASSVDWPVNDSVHFEDAGYAGSDTDIVKTSDEGINHSTALATLDTIHALGITFDAHVPVADFTADVTLGPVPLTVNFTDLSTNAPTGWVWDFGDGSPVSNAQNPSHTYTSVGVFTVSLTASNASGSDTHTKPDYITTFAPAPTADFEADILVGYPPLVVQFTDLSTSAVPITSWLWDFGDGYTSTQQNPKHTYNKVQSYTVSLTIENTLSASDTKTQTDYIRVLEIPVLVDFTGQPRTEEAPLQVRFSNLTEYPNDYAEPTWEWDFGDGEQSTQKNPTHTYIQDRFKTVTLAAKIVLIPNVTP